MDINGYRREYLETLHNNFPFVDYISKYTDLTFNKNEWSGVCPLCEYSNITLKVSSWHCKNCLQTPDGDEPIFYSPESFLSKFHRLDIFDAVCFMEGWVTTHTDAEIPEDRYVFIEIPQDSAPEIPETSLPILDDSIKQPSTPLEESA